MSSNALDLPSHSDKILGHVTATQLKRPSDLHEGPRSVLVDS